MKPFLTEADLTALTPYLSMNGNALIHVDVKDYGRKGREILLEYSDGAKYVGNLDSKPFTIKKLQGMSSLVSYFARGKYGQTNWRGNCSGLLIKDLLEHYKPNTFADLAVGSGTSMDVAYDLGYTDSNTFFSDLNPQYGGIDIASPDLDCPLSDFIFFHPPYYVFPGSKMPTYSGNMWGHEADLRDGSRISDPNVFKQWFDDCNANLYRLLRKGGHLAILMGDSRFRGQYYSMFKNMDLYGKLEQVIIKEQHNTVSGQTNYGGKFIPIAHEYLVILRKDGPFIVPISCTRPFERDIRKSEKTTWANLIAMILDDNNGCMNINDLVATLEKTEKAKTNNHVRAKVRQELQRHTKMFVRTADAVSLVA